MCSDYNIEWLAAIPSERPHQTQLSQDKKQTKESHQRGSPLFDMVGAEGFEPSEWWSQSPLPYHLATPQ